MTETPTFLTTASERKVLEAYDDPFMHCRYEDAFAGMFHWSGLPEGCPEDFVTRAFFQSGSVSGKYAGATFGNVICKASVRSYDIYGRPASWIPSYKDVQAVEELLKESDNPVLYTPVPLAARIESMLKLKKAAHMVIKENIAAMTKQVIVTGVSGGEVASMIVMDSIDGGEISIPAVKESLGVSLLDLKPTDHTAALIGVADYADREILTECSIKNSGTEKASGITAEETVSITQQLAMTADAILAKFKAWADAMNKKLGWNLSVEYSEGYLMDDLVRQTAEGTPDAPEQKENKGE